MNLLNVKKVKTVEIEDATALLDVEIKHSKDGNSCQILGTDAVTQKPLRMWLNVTASKFPNLKGCDFALVAEYKGPRKPGQDMGSCCGFQKVTKKELATWLESVQGDPGDDIS